MASPTTLREILAKRARDAGLNLPSDAISGLVVYFQLLAKWNEKISMTSLRVSNPDEETLDRLLLEPILASKYLPGPSSIVVDIGSGGGSPAIPMKIFAPGISMRMVESKTRKAAFLREAVRLLGLTRTDVDVARFEDLLTRPELRQSADVVTIRAVRADPGTLTVLEGFLRPGGLLFHFRSSAGTDRLGSLPKQLTLEGSHSLIPHLGSTLAVFRKSS